MSGKDSDKRGPAPTGPLPPPEKLPSSLQNIIDKADREDNFYDELYDGTYVTYSKKDILTNLRNYILNLG
jgi:hypothetical protein